LFSGSDSRTCSLLHRWCLNAPNPCGYVCQRQGPTIEKRLADGGFTAGGGAFSGHHHTGFENANRAFKL
jgi:hypothetical protein